MSVILLIEITPTSIKNIKTGVMKEKMDMPGHSKPAIKNSASSAKSDSLIKSVSGGLLYIPFFSPIIPIRIKA